MIDDRYGCVTSSLPRATMSLCTRCGFDPSAEDKQRGPPSKTSLRSRLSDLDALIALLTAERQSLQAESDAIIYPVLSLPPEITTEIFLRCLPSELRVRTSSYDAPLLLGQICRQWRQIALSTPHLWRSLLFRDGEISVGLLHLWLSRSRDVPLIISLKCWDPPRAESLIDATLLHAHHLEQAEFGLPLTSFSKLDLRTISFPMLRTISLDIVQQSSEDSVRDTVILLNAPLLRHAHLSTLPHVKIDVPWEQMTTLTLRMEIELTECISLLRGCPALVNLTVSTTGVAAPHTDLLTLESVEALTCNFGDASILEHVILPRLQRLTVSETTQPGHATILQAFIRRSACPVQSLSISIGDVMPDTLMACFRAIPDTVSDFGLTWRRGSCPEQLFSALEPIDVLPRLNTVRLQGGRLSDEDYQNLVDMLHSRVQVSPPRVTLRSLSLKLTTYAPLHNRRYMPRNSTMAELRTLAAEGLNIKFTMVGRSNYSTHVVLDSGAA